jgi:hypothetical protein
LKFCYGALFNHRIAVFAIRYLDGKIFVVGELRDLGVGRIFAIGGTIGRGEAFGE